MGLDPPWRPTCPSIRAVSSQKMAPVIMTTFPILEGGQRSDGCYSMKTTLYGLVLQLLTRNLTYLCSRVTEGRGEEGVFFQQLREEPRFKPRLSLPIANTTLCLKFLFFFSFKSFFPQ